MTRHLKSRLDRLEAWSPAEVSYVLSDRPVDDDADLGAMIDAARKRRGVAYAVSPAPMTEREWLSMVGVGQ